MVQALAAVQLLSPNIPLLFMGEEWGSQTPFYFFCNHGPDLAPLVTEGRRNEFSKFPEFSSPEMQEKIPDPCSRDTFVKSKINWADLSEAEHKDWFAYYKNLLELRQSRIVPNMRAIKSGAVHQIDDGLVVEWRSENEIVMAVVANLTDKPGQLTDGNLEKFAQNQKLETLFRTSSMTESNQKSGVLPPYTVLWLVAKENA